MSDPNVKPLKLRIQPDIKPLKLRIRSNPYIWDGTFIGSFDSSVIINSSEYLGLNYIQINLWSFITYGILVPGTSLSCIYDELKEAFGLVKTGTHTIEIKGKSYVLYRAMTSSGTVIFDDVLSETIVKKYGYLDVAEKITSFIAYRNLIGVSPNTESNIRIRKSNTGWIHPVSFNDKFLIDEKKGLIKNGIRPATEKLFLKWFKKETTYASEIRRMLHFNSGDDVVEKVSEIRSKIQEVTHRIDKDLIWLENIICNKVIDYLEDI